MVGTLYVSSIFRNASDYIPRYFAQLDALYTLVRPAPMHVIIAEGDSTDDTSYKLRKFAAESGYLVDVHTVNHGGPVFPSIDDPLRWEQIALVCNVALDQVRHKATAEDFWLYVEADLMWQAPNMVNLLNGLTKWPAVAAMSFHPGSYYFYDTWGHRKDGIRFDREPPYHPALVEADRYVEVDSAGSCFAVRGQYLPGLGFSRQDCILGIGRTLRQMDAPLFLDTEAEVIHP